MASSWAQKAKAASGSNNATPQQPQAQQTQRQPQQQQPTASQPQQRAAAPQPAQSGNQQPQTQQAPAGSRHQQQPQYAQQPQPQQPPQSQQPPQQQQQQPSYGAFQPPQQSPGYSYGYQPPSGYAPLPQQQPYYQQQPQYQPYQQPQQQQQGFYGQPPQQYGGYSSPYQQQQQQPSPYQPQQQQQPGQPHQAPQQRAVAAPVPHNKQPATQQQQPQPPQSGAQNVVKPEPQRPAAQPQQQPPQQAPRQPAPQQPPQSQPPRQAAPQQQPAPAPQPAAAPQSSAAPDQPYIGCKISLISNANVRYEGTLYTIDPAAGTVALNSVRCYGTENRSTANFYIPATNDIYEYIVFAGKDIKELSVLDSVAEQKAAPQAQPPSDPAIQSMGSIVKAPEPKPAQPTVAKAPSVDSDEQKDEGFIARRKPNNFARGPDSHSPRQQQSTGFANRRGAGNSNNGAAPRTGFDVTARNRRDKDEITKDFDFQASNARFNKDDLATALKEQLKVGQSQDDEDTNDEANTAAQNDDAGSNGAAALSFPSAAALDLPAGATAEDLGVKYDKKKSFFDDISRDNTAGRPRDTRNKNVDTFGSAARNFQGGGSRGGRGGGGYRGRGGRDDGFGRRDNDDGFGQRRDNNRQHQRRDDDGDRQWRRQ